MLDAFADDEELPLEGILVESRAAKNEDLADCRTGLARQRADGVGLHRHVSPAEHVLAFFLDDGLDSLRAVALQIGLVWQKKHSHSVLPLDGQAYPQAVALLL